MAARFTCRFEELDADTREYLRAVRRADGRGAPGVYASTPEVAPTIAVIVGPIIILVTLIFASNSVKDAWSVAMLQT
ncbi:MAG: hypothetical protein ACRC7O_05025, partial [Fimbriiglobus sp.]